MSARKLDYLLLSIMVLIGAAYLHAAMNLHSNDNSLIGPSYFPVLLGSLLLFLCVIKIALTHRGEDKRITLPNAKYIVASVVVLMAFFLSWMLIGYFYINVFLFLFILFTIYTGKEKWKQTLPINALVALGTTVAIYIVFGLVLQIRF